MIKVLLDGVILAVVMMMTATTRIDDVAARYGDMIVYQLVLMQPCHCKTRIHTIQLILFEYLNSSSLSISCKC